MAQKKKQGIMPIKNELINQNQARELYENSARNQLISACKLIKDAAKNGHYHVEIKVPSDFHNLKEELIKLDFGVEQTDHHILYIEW